MANCCLSNQLFQLMNIRLVDNVFTHFSQQSSEFPSQPFGHRDHHDHRIEDNDEDESENLGNLL